MRNKLLKIALYAAVLNILFVPLHSGIAKLFGYVTIIATVLYPVLRSWRGGRLWVSKHVLWLLLAVFLSGLTSLGSFQTGKLVDYLVSTGSFVAFYWALSDSSEQRETLKLQEVFRINYLLCAILIAYSFGPFDFKTVVVNQWGTTVFTMGLGNPNAVSMYVMVALVFLVLQILNVRSIWHKLLNACLAAILVYILLLLQSRTVTVCALVLLAFFLLRSKRRVGKWISFAILLLPVLMIFAQLLISRLDIAFTLLGKGLDTGRSEMYREFFENLRQQPERILLGNLFSNNFYNLHNAPLTFINTLGIFGFGTVCVFWVRQVRCMEASCTGRTRLVAFAAMLAFIVHSSAESMGMVGTIPYGTFIIVIAQIVKGNICCGITAADGHRITDGGSDE